MFRLISGLIFIALPLISQVPGTNWEVVSLERDAISICLTIDNPTDTVTTGRIRRTTNATPPLDVDLDFETCTGSSQDLCCIRDARLSPGTTYLIHPATWNGTTESAHTDAGSQTALAVGEATICGAFDGPNCNIVDDGSGNDILQITTPAGGAYDEPVHPTHASTLQNYTITGGTTTLTVNGSNEVQNFQSTLNTVVAAIEADTDGEVYGIQFPAGSVASPDFESGVFGFSIGNFIDTKPNSRLIVFCSAVDSDGDLPLGGRSEDINKPCASIRHAETKPNGAALIDYNSGGRVHFVQITLEAPRHDQISIAPITVDSATLGADTKLNLGAAATGWGNTFGVRVPSLRSPWFRTGYSVGYNGSAESDWILSSGDTIIEPETNIDDDGSDGTGIVYWPSPEPFTGSKEATPTLTFSADHQYSDGYEYTLTSISSGVATVSDGSHNYDLGATFFKQTFYVEGSTGGCDGIYTADSAVQASGTITLATSPTGCTGGTIRQIYPVLIHHLVGPTYDHASCLVTFETTTTAKLLECYYGGSSFTPDWTAVSGTPSGYLVHDPPNLGAFIDAIGASEITFSSGGFNTRGLPWRQNYQILMNEAEDLIFAGNNHLAEYWQPVNPHTESAHADSRLNRLALGEVFDAPNLDDLQVKNSTILTGGFTYFGNLTGTSCPSNHTWEALYIDTPPNMLQGGALNGVARPRRQDFEYKACAQNIYMNGIHRANQVIQSSPVGVLLALQVGSNAADTGTFVKSISDIHVENSYIDGMFGFNIATYITGGGPVKIGINSRIKLNDIFWKDNGLRGGPTGDYLEFATANSQFQGLLVRTAGDSISQFTLEDFTILPSESDDGWTAFMEINQPNASMTIRNGLIMDSGPTSASVARIRTFGGSSAWADIEDKMVQDEQTTLSDQSEVSNIHVVQCTDDATDHDFASANDPANVNAVWDVTGWNDSGRVTLHSTTSAESCQDRMDDVFLSTGYQPNATYDDKGADWEAVLNAQGRILDIVAKVTSSSLVLTYKAPTTTRPCTAAVAEGDDVNFFTASTVYGATDTPGGSQDRSLTVSGLPSATQFSVRLSCELGGTVRGLATTL